MCHKVEKKYYFAAGHTADGFVNFLSSNVEGFHTIYILKHPSVNIKTKFLKAIIEHLEKDEKLEVLLSAYSQDDIEGIVLRSKRIAVISDVINPGQLTNSVVIDLRREQIETEEIEKRRNDEYAKAYHHLEKGLSIHDDLEHIYIREMDFNKADLLAESFINELLQEVSPDVDATIYRRMLGTNTANGSINIIPQLIKNIEKRVYIKGRAGTGKSVFMNKVAKACEQVGLGIEYYHCSFDPNSIDMIIVPTLNFCMFDSTAPHEYDPERPEDQVIDLYREAVTPGTDEKYAQDIKRITESYQSYVKKGMDHLRRAQLLQEEIETLFNHTSIEAYEEIIAELVEQIGSN